MVVFCVCIGIIGQILKKFIAHNQLQYDTNINVKEIKVQVNIKHQSTAVNSWVLLYHYAVSLSGGQPRLY